MKKTLLPLIAAQAMISLTNPIAQGATVLIDGPEAKNLFFALARAGAPVTPLNHHHDREYAIQQSIHVYRVFCEISAEPSCSLFRTSNQTKGEELALRGQDALDAGNALAAAGVGRISVSGNWFRISIRELNCILSGSEKTAVCRALE